jgi:cytidylate kinase
MFALQGVLEGPVLELEFMKITVSGIVGSGKSTVSKMLAERLGYDYFSVGGIMRQMAIERRVHLKELTEEAKTDGGLIDKELDERQIEIGKEKDDFVMDSRLGFHFIPNSFKVFLYVSEEEGARRIFSAARGEESYSDFSEALSNMKKRISSEKQRYRQYYKIDFPEGCNFDLRIDTTNVTPEAVVENIVCSLQNFIKLKTA